MVQQKLFDGDVNRDTVF